MKLLILGVIAIIMIGVASGAACLRDSDGFWQWRDDVRARTFEARERARQAREDAREQSREFRRQRREEMQAWRDAARERREQIREQIREWRYTY